MDTMRSERKVAIAAWLLLCRCRAGRCSCLRHPCAAAGTGGRALQRHQWVVRDVPGDLAAGQQPCAARQPAAAARPAALLQDSGVEAEVIGKQRVLRAGARPWLPNPVSARNSPMRNVDVAMVGCSSGCVRCSVTIRDRSRPLCRDAAFPCRQRGPGACARAAVRQWQRAPRCAPAASAAALGAGARCRCAAAAGNAADPTFRHRPRLWRAPFHDFKDSNMSNGTAGAVDLMDHLLGAYDELKRRLVRKLGSSWPATRCRTRGCA